MKIMMINRTYSNPSTKVQLFLINSNAEYKYCYIIIKMYLFRIDVQLFMKHRKKRIEIVVADAVAAEGDDHCSSDVWN